MLLNVLNVLRLKGIRKMGVEGGKLVELDPRREQERLFLFEMEMGPFEKMMF